MGNLINGVWNERQLDPDLVPEVVRDLIGQCRASRNCKKAAPAGRCFYVAIRDEAFEEVAALNSILQPYMDTLFRLAARGHWIKERRPVRLGREGSLMSASLPAMKRGGLTLNVHSANTDLSFEIEVEPGGFVYSVAGYPQIREFNALLTLLTVENAWTGVAFHAAAHSGTATASPIYRVRRMGECATIRFNVEDWNCLQELFAEAMTHPALQVIFSELALIYGQL